MFRFHFMNTKKQFEKISGLYDSQRRALIPCFEDFYKTASALQVFNSDSPSILDLGAGTGIFSEFFKQKYPRAHFTLLDISPKMLAIAREKFGADSDYCEADFTHVANFPDESFCAVISALAIHHIPDDQKRLLFAEIFRILKKGGIFINAEQVLGESDFLRSYFAKQRLEIVDKYMDAAQARIARKRLACDMCATISDQLEWLSQVGFKEVGNIYRYLDFAVIFAIKQ